MAKRVVQRILIALGTIFIIISLSFLLIHVMPGDPIIHLVGQEEYYYLLDSNPEELERLEEKYGLNDSLFQQYLRYLKSIATLDFGTSYSTQLPVVDTVFSACKWTLILAIPVWLLGGLIGAILGVLAGYRPGKLFDRIMTPIFVVINTIPSNCLSILFLVIFAYKLQIFPINGMVAAGTEGLERIVSICEHMCLPFCILLLFRISSDFLLMKSSVSQVRKEEYIITATSKGLSEKKVLFRHVMKNALLPYLTSFCMQFGSLLSGSMIVEVIFGWKGMGTLLYNAVSTRDFPTAQFCFLLTAFMVVFANLVSDVLNAALDPRLREEGVNE